MNCEINPYLLLGIGISLIVIFSMTLIFIIKRSIDARDKLLEDKSITVKGVIHDKTRGDDADNKSFQRMEVIVLIDNRFKLYLNVNTIEEYLKYSIGDEILLKVNDTGSIHPIGKYLLTTQTPKAIN